MSKILNNAQMMAECSEFEYPIKETIILISKRGISFPLLYKAFLAMVYLLLDLIYFPN